MAENNQASTRPEGLPPEIDINIPHVSRVFDFALGGTANFESDRAIAAHAFANWPGEVGGLEGVKVDIGGARNALIRIVRYLTAEVGIRQFLDICSGLPTENNTHEVAWGIAPESRTVYVDKDPIVVAHSRYLLGSSDERTDYLEGDLHDPHDILARASSTLDFSQPVGVILFGALHFFPDEEAPDKIVDTLVRAVPSGSHFALSHFARVEGDDTMDETFEQLNKQWGESVVRRTPAEVIELFDGLELVEPGIVELPDWRPDPGTTGPRPMPMWTGAFRKP